MTLIIDHYDKRKNELKKLLNLILKELSPKINSIIVLGSLGYNWDHKIFTSSDLDLMILGSEKSFIEISTNKLLSSNLYGINKISELYNKNELDIISVKGFYENIPFTLHYLTQELFLEMCNLNEFSLKSFRQRPKQGSTRFYNFDGSYINYKFDNNNIKNGFIHKVVSSIFKDNRCYVGILHGRLLHFPRTVLDKTGITIKNVNILWKRFIDRMIEENKDFLNLKNVNPLLALKNSKYFSEELKSHIMEVTIEHLKIKGINYIL